MASRRKFLQVGIAALTLPISARAVLAPAADSSESTPGAIPLYKVIFDERFAACVAFGAKAERLGLPVHSIRGDITDLWFHDLDARWKKSPVAIAGLTGQGALFCLERLAWDQGMRVAYRGEHRLLPDRSIEHALTGPENAIDPAAGLQDDENWAAHVAILLARFPETPSVPARAMMHTCGSALADGAPEDLISWVIAPVARAPIMRRA